MSKFKNLDTWEKHMQNIELKPHKRNSGMRVWLKNASLAILRPQIQIPKTIKKKKIRNSS
jgi:hypothetical protein